MDNQNNNNQNGNLQTPAHPNAQTPQQPQGALPTSAMAVTSLVLGIIGIATSFLPVINNGSFFLGILGVIFGIVGIVGINKGKKKGKGLGIAGIVLSVITIAVVLIAQSLFSAALDSAMNTTNTSSSSQQSQQQSSASNASAATDSSSAPYEVSIDDATLTTDYAGNQALLVNFTFTNNSDDEASFAVNIMDKAFQNGVQLDTAIVADADTSTSLNTIKPGATINVSQAFALNDTSPVTVEVSETFSFSSDLIAEKTFDIA